MSDLLTHWAVYDDCRRLAGHQADEVVDPVFRELIEAHRDEARLGAVTRGGGRLMPIVLGNARERWRAGDVDDTLRRKIAFVLGGLTHQACDNTMKPLLTSAAGSDWNDAHHGIQQGGGGAPAYSAHLEVSAYYDTHVFRKVYLAGDEEPFNRFLLAQVDAAPGQALEEFVRGLFQRALIASHTLKPDLSDPDAWLERLFSLLQPLYVDIPTFVEIYHHPDPEKMKRYRVETDFYLDDDPAIQVARSTQRGEPVVATRAREAVAPGTNASHYGRALEVGIDYLRRASAFWRFETDELSTPNWSAKSANA